MSHDTFNQDDEPLPPSKRLTDNTDSSDESTDSGGYGSRVRTREKKEDTTNNEQTQDTAEKTDTCPECGGDLSLDQTHGDRSCTDCGLVVDEETIDRGPEWRAFNSKERDEKSRVGAPTSKLRHDNGMTTNIGWQDKDAYGNPLNTSQRKKMQRLRKWNGRVKAQDSKERNLRNALGELSRMSSALGVPKEIQEIAAMIYRRALDENLLPGRSIEGVTTAALYAACRKQDVPRSLHEMEQVSRVDEKEIARTYRYINKELGLDIGPSDPAEYVPRIIGNIDGVTQRTERLANKLINHIKNEPGLISGKSPVGLAASSIYLAGRLTGETPTQSEISDAAGVTKVTIRDRFQDLSLIHI